MDEQQRAIQRERRYRAKRDGRRDIVDQYRTGQRTIADQGGGQHVGPVDCRIGLSDILGQIARGAQHRLVVLDRFASDGRRRLRRLRRVAIGLAWLEGLLKIHATIYPKVRRTRKAAGKAGKRAGVLTRCWLGQQGRTLAERL